MIKTPRWMVRVYDASPIPFCSIYIYVSDEWFESREDARKYKRGLALGLDDPKIEADPIWDDLNKRHTS